MVVEVKQGYKFLPAFSLHIKGYVATIDALPSSAVQGDIYGVGPTYDPSDTEQTNPMV